MEAASTALTTFHESRYLKSNHCHTSRVPKAAGDSQILIDQAAARSVNHGKQRGLPHVDNCRTILAWLPHTLLPVRFAAQLLREVAASISLIGSSSCRPGFFLRVVRAIRVQLSKWLKLLDTDCTEDTSEKPTRSQPSSAVSLGGL